MDPVDHSSKLQFVRSQLAAYSGIKKDLDGSTFVLCPYHSERTPSGQVFYGPGTRVPGFFMCRGCGQKAHWNDVAPLLNLIPFSKPKPNEDAFAVGLLQTPQEDRHFKFELEPLPKNKVWRDIKTNMMRKIGCKIMVTEWGDRLVYLPVMINGEERGWIRSLIKKDPTGDIPTHRNKKGSWSKRFGLFPFDYAIGMMRKMNSTTIILVEGPRDALRLISYGIPAMAILGTHAWTEYKASLLEIHGVETVGIMMDGDEAGIIATDVAQEYLGGLVKTKLIRLWKMKGNPYPHYESLSLKRRKKIKHTLWDPGNCPTWVLDKVLEKFYKGK